MSEFTGAVLLAQHRKVDTVIKESLRTNTCRVYDGIRDLAGLKPRLLPDPAGELGSAIYLGFKSRTFAIGSCRQIDRRTCRQRPQLARFFYAHSRMQKKSRPYIRPRRRSLPVGAGQLVMAQHAVRARSTS